MPAPSECSRHATGATWRRVSAGREGPAPQGRGSGKCILPAAASSSDNFEPSLPLPPPEKNCVRLAALNSHIAPFSWAVDRACRSDGSGWTSAQFNTTMRMLCASEHGAVLREDLEAALGPGGEEAVLALMRRGMLGMRPGHSEWEQQFPLEAWGGRPEAQLVTASDAIYMYEMREALAEAQAEAAKAQAKAAAAQAEAAGAQAGAGPWQQLAASVLRMGGRQRVED